MHGQERIFFLKKLFIFNRKELEKSRQTVNRKKSVQNCQFLCNLFKNHLFRLIHATSPHFPVCFRLSKKININK